MIRVLRLGHRRGRDDRISTHVGLVARAFGADKIIYAGEEDKKMLDSILDVVDRWGGDFQASYSNNWRSVINEFEGIKIQLTMYGLPYQDKLTKISQKSGRDGSDLLVIVGAEKVPKEVYELVDYNLAVNNQPHSEVAALGIFLHDLLQGHELERDFKDAKIRIIPEREGKNLKELD